MASCQFLFSYLSVGLLVLLSPLSSASRITYAPGQAGPSYGSVLSYGYDLINTNEDMVTHVETAQNGPAGLAISSVSSPHGNYTTLIRNDLGNIYLYYPFEDGWFCLWGKATQTISPLSLAGFQYLTTASMGGQPVSHFRSLVLNEYLIGAYLDASGNPAMITNPSNMQEIWMVTSFQNQTAPPNGVFTVPSFCTGAQEMPQSYFSGANVMKGFPTSTLGASLPRLLTDVQLHNTKTKARGYKVKFDAGLSFACGFPFGADLNENYPVGEPISAMDLLAATQTMPKWMAPSGVTVPPALDNSAYATPVRNQGACGCCWAFSSLAATEVAVAFTHNSVPTWLSPQYLIDCAGPYANKTGLIATKGCLGGWQPTALSYLVHNGALSEVAYPYMGVNGVSCPGSGSLQLLKGFQIIAPGSITGIEAALASYGAVASIIQVLGDFVFYTGGIYNNPSCTGAVLSHGITIVGYGNDPATGHDYWLVKNSFGREWGEGGYFRMIKGVNMCGIENWGIVPIPV